MSIKQNTYLNAVTTAKELSAKNIHLTARPSSLLGELMDLSTSFIAPKTTDAPAILSNPGYKNAGSMLDAEERANSVSGITGDFNKMSQHSLKIAALAEDIAPHITSHVSFARNTVAPLVVEMAGKMEKYLQTAKPTDPTSLFEIVQGSIPALVTDESFVADGLENYDGLNVQLKSINFTMAIPEESDFYAGLTQLSSQRLNELVADWLKTKEQDYIKFVYIANFANSVYDYASFKKPVHEYLLGDAMGSSNNPYQILDNALAAYLIANRLFNDPQMAKGVSLGEYKAAIRNVIDYSGSAIVKALKTIRRQIEGNVIVSEAILSKKRVVVNRVVYQSWLQSGGKPEVILGMLASGEVRYSVASIEEIKDKLIRHWQNFVMLSQADIKGELHKRFKDYIVSEMTLSLEELSEMEQDFAHNCVDYKQRVMANVEKELEHFNHRLMDDIQHLALHLVAKARFFFTSSYSILNEMAEVAKLNPEIDPREAALLSVINYVAEYLEGQIQVTA